MTYNSQWSQDKWLNENIFRNKRNGIFVDVGAHDGVDINNTLFYEKNLGWTGICVEPIPEIFAKLQENRAANCVNGCAYNKDGIVPFICIEGYCEMLSGVRDTYCSQHVSRIDREMKQYGGQRKTLYMNAYRLETLLDTYGISHVDYLSVDTEGSELQVLQGINFDKVTIDVIEVEVNYQQDEKILGEFLSLKGYEFKVKLGGDVVYIKK